MVKPLRSRPRLRHGSSAKVIAVAALALGEGVSSGEDLAASMWQSSGTHDATDQPRWYCVGGYVEPPTPLPSDADADRIEVTARELQSSIGVSTTITGDVRIRQGNRLLTAPKLIIDEVAAVARTDGPMRLAEPGLHMLGEQAAIGLADAAASVAGAQFVYADLHLRGVAQRIEKDAGILRLSDTSLTRCAPGRDPWRLHAAQLRVDRDAAIVTARNVRLALGGVPVLVLPYARFSLREQRATGLLFPDLGYDDDGGLDVSLPYYINLARNYDATVTGRLVSERGVGIEGEFRHRSRATRSELRAAMLRADDVYDGRLPRRHLAILDSDPSTAFTPADRWLVDATHSGRMGAFSTVLDYAAVSDNDYLADFGASLDGASRVALERRAQVAFAGRGLHARLWTQSFQRLQPGTTPHRRLPALDVRYTADLIGPLAWSVDASWDAFAATGGSAIGDRRAHVAPRLLLPVTKPWGALQIAAGGYRTHYDVDGAGPLATARQRRSIRFASADGRLFFDRPRAGGAAVQTLEPRIRYLYRSYAAQAHLPQFETVPLTPSYRRLFSDRQRAGIDRIGDANQIAIGLSSRLLDAANGKERLAAGLGAITHLGHHKLPLDGAIDQSPGTSHLVAELRAVSGATKLGATIAWDAAQGAVDEAGLGVSYAPDARRMVNIGYRRQALAGVDQTDVSLHWPLARRLNAFGRWNHDWRSGQTIESFAGIAYESCCLAVKVLWHETLDAPRNGPLRLVGKDRGVHVQVVLRGLAGFGTKVESRLERGIKGYRREEDSR